MLKEFAMQKKFLAAALKSGFFGKAVLISVLLMAMIVGVTGCSPDTDSESSENSILGITLTDSSGNPVPTSDLVIDEENSLITVKVAKGQDVTSLTPVLTFSSGADLVRAGNSEDDVPRDFTNPVAFLIKAENGSTRPWTVLIAELGSENEVTGVYLADSEGHPILQSETEINTEKSQITVQVQGKRELTGIRPVLVIPEGARVITEGYPGPFDFTGIAQSFTVKAQNGKERLWTLAVQLILSSEKEITGVYLTNGDTPIWKTEESIDPLTSQIWITVPAGTPLTEITPVLEVSPGANVTTEIPEEGGIDFTTPQIFTVEAEDGTTRAWTLAVLSILSSETEITGISLKNSDGDVIREISETIDPDRSRITVTLPVGTDLSEITPVLEVSPEASVIAEGNPGAFDFTTGPKLFTVKAQDETTRVWTLTVNREPTSVLGLNVELEGDYDVRFGFSYPNHQDEGVDEPDYTGYDYDIKAGNPIKLSYFFADNAIYDGETRRTYYNTLVVSAAGFTNVTWKIDGKTAPTNNSSYAASNNILTIRAQDWTLKNTHTVVFTGTRNSIKYSGTFEFKVVEKEGNE
jgi:hypothetical protein